MSDTIVWIIIAAFYAPLHFVLPVIVVFVTHKGEAASRSQRIRATLLDSFFSMLAAFAIAIPLAQAGLLMWGMGVLLVSMFIPFVRLALSKAR